MKTLILILAFLTASLPAAEPALSVIHFRDIQDPTEVLAAPDGTYYLSSADETGLVHHYNAAGVALGTLDFSSFCRGTLTGLDIDSQGRLGVVDVTTNTVWINATATGLPLVLGEGFGWGLSEPQDLAFGPDSRVFVSDKGNPDVAVFNTVTGAYIGSWGASIPGGLVEPLGLCASSTGLFVADASTGLVHLLDWTGALVKTYGTQGSGPGQLQRPVAVGVDGLGKVWVADQSNAKVVVYNQDGTLLAEHSQSADGTALSSPNHLYVSTNGTVAVTDGPSANLLSWNTGQVFVRFPLSTNGVGVAGAGPSARPTSALALVSLVAGPVPARAGERIIVQALQTAETINWELFNLDQSRISSGHEVNTTEAAIGDTASLGSGIYYLKMRASANGVTKEALQKIVITR